MSEDDVFPDRDMSHRDKVLFMVEREGWAMDNVATQKGLDPPFPRYSFTIGLEDKFGFPEVVVLGLSPVACRGLFDLVVGFLASGTDLPIGAPFIGLLDGGQPCALLEVDATSTAEMFPSLAEHHQLAGHARDAFRIVQLAWPDQAGALPWEPHFAPELLTAQLLLGDPPT